MKELTIEQKARAYDEALERASIAYKDEDSHLKATLERIFPEFKESKGEWIEKIRQELISYLERREVKRISESDAIHQWINWLEKQGEIIDVYEDKLDRCACESFDKGYKVALEKQGEQKPTDNAEPRFNVGDWVTNNCAAWRIENIHDGLYDIKGPNGYVQKNVKLKLIDTNFHLWTIKDAKDGDVLVTHMSPEGDWIGIYKQSTDGVFKTHCFLNTVGEFVINPNRCKNHGTHGLHPATKEQRNLLFQKMKEEGYEWDAEKKGGAQ